MYSMIIGDRLRTIRESKNLSQGDIQLRTGLLRCYVSRVENGHTVPSVESLEKFARAMEMELYQILYDSDDPPLPTTGHPPAGEWGSSGKAARYFRKLIGCLQKMSPADRVFIFDLAKTMAKKKSRNL